MDCGQTKAQESTLDEQNEKLNSALDKVSEGNGTVAKVEVWDGNMAPPGALIFPGRYPLKCYQMLF